MKRKWNKFTSILALLFLLAAILACNKEDDLPVPDIPGDHEKGDIAEIKSLGMYSSLDIQQLLENSGAEFPFQLKYEVEAFAVKYYTTDQDGNIMLVSGGLYLPKTLAAIPVISIQHGTETKRDRVASVAPENSVEGIIGLLTSSMGYLTLIPDYPGFGVSTCMHPYLHANSNVPSVIDLIFAGKSFCKSEGITLGPELFLMGYSEGGYLSLLSQKEIEDSYRDQLDITAVAPLSGPYDLNATCDIIFGGGSYSTPAYVAFFLTAYNEIYGWNCLGNFFRPPYASMMPAFFDGSNTWGHIVNQLPSEMSELMRDDFISNYYNKQASMLLAAIAENTVLDWNPAAPVHFFHGDCDDIVDCINASNAMESFLANGATDVQLTLIPGGNHATSGPFAIEGALQWFENFQ